MEENKIAPTPDYSQKELYEAYLKGKSSMDAKVVGAFQLGLFYGTVAGLIVAIIIWASTS